MLLSERCGNLRKAVAFLARVFQERDLRIYERIYNFNLRFWRAELASAVGSAMIILARTQISARYARYHMC
ncbi:hypothetical protein D6817_00740 [Candidatus Pacearchaeota archaeon]|nr:MAG: hypothetical protein D6817_00740 [Candidatus Pacearchaeota archaeon]